MASQTNYTVVIDIGTSKMAGFAGRKNEEGQIEIAGKSKVLSKGIRRGVVFNVDEAASSLKKLLEGLEMQIDEDIERINISYAGQPMHVSSYKASRLTSKDGIVTQADVDELAKEAQTLQVEPGFKILHIIPRTYIVDGEVTGMTPAGITGRKIEADFKVLSVPDSILVNFNRVAERAGVEIEDITFAPLATGEAVLTEEEKELGAIVVDIGAGTTKVSVYQEDTLIHTAVIPFAGNVVTNDIKEGCSILLKWAEQLKIQYGQALGDFTDDRKVVTIPGHNGWEPKEISFKSLAFIIQARMEEIIDGVNFQIEHSGMGDQGGLGIVLTGGTSNLNNLISLVKFRTGMDARLAHPAIKPESLKGEKDIFDYLTALGLMKLSLEHADPTPKIPAKKKKKNKNKNLSPWWINVVQGVLDYVDDDDDVALK